eukprot:GCRY01002280.1.p1 GENE.GCRY01002280.1~~GCRY01002280.1.p1  ORF type:complete len:603 (+),score=70.59 GCRY01002280.1:136-1944(+)
MDASSRLLTSFLLFTFIFSCFGSFWLSDNNFVFLQDIRFSPVSELLCSPNNEGDLFYSSSENCIFFCDGERVVPLLEKTGSTPHLLPVEPSALLQIEESPAPGMDAMPMYSRVRLEATSVHVTGRCWDWQVGCLVYSAEHRTLLYCDRVWLDYIARYGAEPNPTRRIWPGVSTATSGLAPATLTLAARGLCLRPGYTVFENYTSAEDGVVENTVQSRTYNTYPCSPAVAGAFHAVQVSATLSITPERNSYAFCDGKRWRETGLTYKFDYPCNGTYMVPVSNLTWPDYLYGIADAQCSCAAFDYIVYWCEGDIPHCMDYSPMYGCVRCEPGYTNNAGKQCINLGLTEAEMNSPTVHHWDKVTDPCSDSTSVDGIFCSDGVVTRLTVSWARTLPPSLNDFVALFRLEFFGAQLSGTVPRLAALRHVQSFSLFNTELSGPFPQLSDLPNLYSCYMYGNNFDSIGQLKHPRLSLLFLFGNSFTGPLPDFSQMTALEYLSLSGNHFSGSLNETILPAKLEILELNNNTLTGPLPDLSGFPALNAINLSANYFTGEVSVNALPPHSVTIHLQENCLTSTHYAGNALEEWPPLPYLDEYIYSEQRSGGC